MKVSLVLTVSVLVGGLFLGSGCVKRQGNFSQSPAPAASSPISSPAVPSNVITITQAPPPAQIEVVGAAPASDYAWIPGHWEWQGQWIWTSGQWAKAPRPEAVWVPGRWTRRLQGWVWIRGYWRYSVS